jgi:6,7-dimethyl-8-ribityllumazine synthase
MPNTYEGTVTACDGRFAVVVARFNRSITSRLLEGAIETLTARGVPDEHIDVAWVPGAFEIPTVAARLAASGRYAAILCLGAVIRGETSHDQHINRAVSHALAQIGVQWQLPVLFGVLTCNTLEQAIVRSGGALATTGKDQSQARIGNKGVDCAEAALEMVSLLAKLPPPNAKATPTH